MKKYLTTKDYSISGEEFSLQHNEQLDMLITQPRPSNLEKYYESEDYISHTDAKVTFTDKLYQFVKQINLKVKLRLINSCVNGRKTLLDVGAGTGDFLSYAKQRGWETSGVEPNAKAREKASEKGLSLSVTLNQTFNTKYQVITLWHVLEHIPNLEETLDQIAALLDEDGVLVIAVPNFKSFDAQFYKQYWAAYDVPRHLWHFSREAITQLLNKRRMNLVTTKPMWFDAFYVALLSEKYKTGRQNFIKAFFVGLYSNCKGLFTKEYASHIYIFKKS